MADHTKIQWTDATWNPIAGCSILSSACTNCYAMAQAARIVRCAAGLGRTTHYADTITTVKGKPVWTGEIRAAPDHVLTQPLRWRRPRRIFVNSMSDLFHEAVPDAWIDRIFAVMALAPQHTFQVLTKRPERMRAYISDLSRDAEGLFNALSCVRLKRAAEYVVRNDPRPAYDWKPGWPLPNVRLGVTAEDQPRADERIPILLDTPAAKRFVSIEPMLGPVDLTELTIKKRVGEHCFSALECDEIGRAHV
jgi:protein gp37